VKYRLYLHPLESVQALLRGTLAQLVEQWTENPCVPGSIPGGTTKNPLLIIDFQGVLFFGYLLCTTMCTISSKKMKKTILIMAVVFGEVACSGKSTTPSTEGAQEAQEIQVEVIDSTSVSTETEWEATEEVISEETTEKTATEASSN